MMEAEQINRLREEQLSAITETSNRIKQLGKFRGDYVALKDRLLTLPQKITHDVMVPFGELAFMPGQLIHTNEIMVLLGDNWFVDRSASQAADIVTRRIKGLDEQIKDLEKQKGLLEPRLQFTSELTDVAEGRGDISEIKEEYDEEKEKLWREQHRKSVRMHREQLRKERTGDLVKSTGSSAALEATHDQLMARLDELAAKEEQSYHVDKDHNVPEYDSAENDGTETDEGSSDLEKDDIRRKKVRWKDGHTEKHRVRRNVINFSHSPVMPEAVSSKEIRSPGDVYHHFHSAPSSILKSPSAEFPTAEPVVQKPTHTVLPGPADAFTGAIVERKLADAEESTSESQPGESAGLHTGMGLDEKMQPRSGSAIVEPEPPKRVSKFKSQRQQKLR